jgi:phosphatidyl-myo-inositol dimannoside synthase
MAHLLVTNDFPPKIGGIQSYLWELWRRLPAGEATVFTTPYAGTAAFDAAAPLPIVRSRQKVLLPTPALTKQVLAEAARVGASFAVLDPAVPLGWIGPDLAKAGLPYAVVLHGAEVTVPGRLPGARQALARVLEGAIHVIAAGGYPLAEAERCVGHTLASTVIPPGVDVDSFRPVAHEDERVEGRRQLGLPAPAEGDVIVCASRLVPRKGFDACFVAAAAVAQRRASVALTRGEQARPITVAVAGGGRDRSRLERAAARVRTDRSLPLDIRFLGRVSDDDLRTLHRCGDVFAMLCRNRWGGLEQEGFGIVFVEAAASGTPQLAGRSGGSHEAVVHGVTGFVVNPTSVDQATEALANLLDDPARRAAFAVAGRQRSERELSYDVLAHRLTATLAELTEGRAPYRCERSRPS